MKTQESVLDKFFLLQIPGAKCQMDNTKYSNLDTRLRLNVSEYSIQYLQLVTGWKLPNYINSVCVLLLNVLKYVERKFKMACW